MVRYGTMEEALKKMETEGLISVIGRVEDIRSGEEGTAVTFFGGETCSKEMEDFILNEGIGRDFERSVVDGLGRYVDTGAYLEDRLADKSWKMYRFTNDREITYAIVNRISDCEIDYD